MKIKTIYRRKEAIKRILAAQPIAQPAIVNYRGVK